MESTDQIKPIIVFAGNIMEAEIVKSLLENAEIRVYLKDENTGFLAPWNVAPGGLGAVKVVVSSEDAEMAKIVVDDFLKNIKSDTTPDFETE